MSSSTVDQAEQHADAAGHDDPHGEHGAHPTEAKYIKIALILAFVTAVEVALYYWSFSSEAANNAVLVLLAGIKFVMVAAYFMHLKFDNKILRRLFITGFVLAAFCYIAYLLTLGVFQ